MTEELLNIIPTVSNYQIKVEEPLHDVKIINQYGVIVDQKKDLPAFELITIEDLPNGIYFLRGSNDEGELMVGRFIKS